MIISQLDAKIIDVPDREAGIALLKKVEYIARISHRTEDRVTEDSYDRFLRSVVLNHGDFSVIEHASVSVEAELDRGLSHEWVRHRIGAYTQESTRFVNYGKAGDKQIRVIPPMVPLIEDAYLLWEQSSLQAERAYMLMLDSGQSPQMARSVLPTSLATKLVVTYNLRAWRHFFIMRTCREAHPQMVWVAGNLLELFKERIPILYEDIEPGMRQADAMKLLR